MDDHTSEKSRALWDEMASGWERHRAYMWKTTRHVAEWLVDNVDVREGDTVLDLAGGPGDNGFLAAERVGPAGKVIETDFAPQMVDTAQRRAAELGLQNVETRVLDAEKMDLGDDSVDGIICRWGFMLMMDPVTALMECRRVLKEGRRLALSVWGGPAQNPWVTVTGMTMTQLGYPPSRDPFGPGGMFSMAEPETVRSMLSAAGFSDITIEEMPVDWSFASFDEWWDWMRQVAGAIAAVIKDLTPEAIDELRKALRESGSVFQTDTGLTLPGVTINAVAL